MTTGNDGLRRVYITGALGFLGRHVARSFAYAGWRVVGIGHQSTPVGTHAPWGIADLAVGEVSVNLLQDAHQRFGAPSLVVHAAGTSSVWQAAEDPCGELGRTVGSTGAVVDYIRRFAPQARLIYVSSAAIYGNAPVVPIAVDAPLRPSSLYGLHKQMAEELVAGASRIFAIECCAVRYFSLYGPGLAKQLLWDVVRRASSSNEPLLLGGTGSETRDFLHVADAARLLVDLAASAALPAVVNGGTGRATTVREIAERLVAPMSPKLEVRFSGQTRPGDPQHLVADVSGLAALGFEPRIPLGEGVAAYREWATAEIARIDSANR